MSEIIDYFPVGWKQGFPETPCGKGSTIKATELQRAWIPEILRKYDIKSVADIGAGDLNWSSKIDWGSSKYKGYDIIKRHNDVIEFDAANEVPPKVDMIMCIWLLNHLRKEKAQKVIENFKLSGSRYLMVTDSRIAHRKQELSFSYIEKLDLPMYTHGECIKLHVLNAC